MDEIINHISSPALEIVHESRFLHGGINPGLEENISLLKSVDVQHRQRSEVWSEKIEDLSDLTITSPGSPSSLPTEHSRLLTLPPEIIGTIVSYVSAIDLTRLQRTCHVLSSHAHTDKYWQRLIQDNVPGVKVTTTGLCSSFQALYKAHDPHWFLPKYKLWFCDNPFTGKMIIARFDLNRACIEGYRLVAERTLPTFETWKENEVVLIHSFEHRCRLHMDQPVLKLDATPYFSSETNRLSQEIRMRMDERNSNGVFASFLLTRPVEERGNMQLWPPKNIPSHHRVRNASQQLFKGEGHKPSRRSEVCDTSFRIRRWMEMVTPSSPTSPGIHLGEEVYTYSTLDPKWYTPTAEKPWRGIWVGDYSGHGCEFLLMNQPDNIIPFDEESVVQCADETVEEWEERKKVERVYRGSIEAIKLTGDPNIPRGEYTFVADDISEKAYIRTATEAPFKGARIVKSRGHIANRMYENDTYIESQLIMISHNLLAQHWIEFGHISYFKRVDIDAFLPPGVEHDPLSLSQT